MEKDQDDMGGDPLVLSGWERCLQKLDKEMRAFIIFIRWEMGSLWI
jgi:hypothetical protein